MKDIKDINRIKVALAERKRTGKWNSAQPGLETLLEIAQVLECDIKDLLNSTQEEVKYIRVL